jgi:L-fuculose-phosphate aldolase
MPTLAEARQGIVRTCRRLYERGLIAGQDGNVSVRLGRDRVLVTPAGMSKADVTARDLVEVPLGPPGGERRAVGGRRPAGAGRAKGADEARRPSSELAVHLTIYRGRPDVGAVVHAHPPAATGFAVAGERLPENALPELVYSVGPVALVPFAAPGTQALADAFDPWLSGHDAWLMANHGAVTVGATLVVAHQRMESLEHAARILVAARALGRIVPFTPAPMQPDR